MPDHDVGPTAWRRRTSRNRRLLLADELATFQDLIQQAKSKLDSLRVGEVGGAVVGVLMPEYGQNSMGKFMDSAIYKLAEVS